MWRQNSSMKKVSLLDCTLRDGGYINDWEFGHNNIVSVYERLALSGVDIIEVGFIDDRRPFDLNRTIFPDTNSINRIYANVAYKAPMTVAMIDYGTCDISNIEQCGSGFIDGIRVIFKKHRMDEALAFCGQLKGLGYKVFAQLVSITSYEEEDIVKVSKLINEVKPYAVSIVDTYGLLYPETAIKYYEWVDRYVDAGIAIGFHAHNNLQLAYANSLSFINRNSSRDIVVDGTLHGMGKSAGNAAIELLAPYLNTNYSKNYKAYHMLEAYDECLCDIYDRSPWGYKTLFYMSSEYNCHPSYVSFLMDKDNLTIEDIGSILDCMEDGDIRLLYSREYIDNLYSQYVGNKFDDDASIAAINSVFSNRNVLILGPGKNIRLQINRVQKYIEKYSPVIISINYIPEDISVDYVFVTKKNRYQEMTEGLHIHSDIKIINTSDVDIREKALCTILREPLLEQREEIKDNSFLMLLNVLKRAGITKIACAGLDGYSDTEDNYFKQSMEYNFVKTVARRLNYHIREMLATEYKDISIDFITYSHYAEEEDCNNGGF